MALEGERTLLRVYLRSTDRRRWFSATAVEGLLYGAKAAGLAGATVLRGIFGLDVTGRLLESSAWSLVEHVPVIVEVVDEPHAMGRFLTVVERIVLEGMASLQRTRASIYGRAAEPSAMNLHVPGPVTPFSGLPSPDEFPIMKLSESGQLLRIFLGSSDVSHNLPLYRAIVLKAQELKLAGVTVLRGFMGFGTSSRVRTAKLLGRSTDLPIVVELVDSPRKIEGILPFLDEDLPEGLLTINEVRVLRFPLRSSLG